MRAKASMARFNVPSTVILSDPERMRGVVEGSGTSSFTNLHCSSVFYAITYA